MNEYSKSVSRQGSHAAAAADASPSGGNRNVGIEAGRTISFVAVVSIHLAPVFYASYAESFLFGQLGRFAVPFFFIASGYFLYDEIICSIRRTLLRVWKRILIPFAFWLLFYNPNGILQGRWNLGWLLSGGDGFHLWFLPSLAVALMLAAVMLGSLPFRIVVSISIALYAFGLAYGSYGPMLHLSSFWFGTRNGPFFAFPFVVLGCALKRSGLEMPAKGAIAIFCLGALGAVCI